MPDEALVALLQGGNEAAFETIYNRYSRKIYAHIYNRLQSKEVTEEVMQNIFVSLWEKRGSVSIKNLGAYLYTAAKYDVLDHIRSEKVRRSYSSDVAAKGMAPYIENTTEREFNFDELYSVMQQEVNKLPEKCRLIFKLSREEFFSSKEIASQLKISSKTVDNQINKATGVLRVQLVDFLNAVVIVSFLF